MGKVLSQLFGLLDKEQPLAKNCCVHCQDAPNKPRTLALRSHEVQPITLQDDNAVNLLAKHRTKK